VELPTTKREIIRQNPKLLILFSKPKIGKTTLASLLDNNLIIEMEERGADFVSGLIVNVTTARELMDTAKAIADAGKPYKYITLDTATAMEDNIINDIATKMYQNSVLGKDFKGGDMRKLPMGAGQSRPVLD
jgi:replication-associated recombination protein RarA